MLVGGLAMVRERRPGLLYGGSPAYDVVFDLGPELLAYWDANRPDLMTLGAGNAVSSWLDIKAGYAATQGTGAAQPIYSATSFNGAPGLSFDGTDDCLASTAAGLLAALPVAAAGSELWALVQQDAAGAAAGARVAISYGGASGASERSMGRTTSSSNNRMRGSTNGTLSSGPVVNIDTRHVLRYAVGAAASIPHVDGVAGSTLSIVPATLADRVRVGAAPPPSAVSFWRGQIAAVLITMPLSAAKASALSTYLLDRRML